MSLISYDAADSYKLNNFCDSQDEFLDRVHNVVVHPIAVGR